MRVRDHVVLSTAAAAILYPRVGTSVFGAWAASILIDVDHYLWFALRNRRVDPATAIRAFNSAQAPQSADTRLLHHPAVLLTVLLAGTRRRALLMPALGMAFHVGLDLYHRSRTADARAAALKRDRMTCQVCSAAAAGVVPHLWRQPAVLPSYRVDHFVTLCDDCHEVAHGLGVRAVAAADCDWEAYLRYTGLHARLGRGRALDD